MIQEIERILVKHPDVAEVCVVAIAGNGHGDSFKAFVVLRENTLLSAEALTAFCHPHLAEAKDRTEIRILPALPKSPMGRVVRRKLMEMARTQSLA